MKKLVLQILALLAVISSCKNDLPSVASGKIERIENFDSQYVVPRNVDIWLPNGYSSDKKYSVLYMHDGQMLFDADKTWNKQEWMVDENVSELLDSNKIQDCIVVAVWNIEKNRYPDYFPQKAYESLEDSLKKEIFKDGIADNSGADNYLKFLVKELKPYIDNKYSVYTDMQHTFIAGSSMGGLISMYAICEYPDVYSGAACISTHWPGYKNFDDNTVAMAFNSYLSSHLPDKSNHKIYFDFGTETLDQHYEQHQVVIDSTMRANAWDESNWITMKFEGENHSENSWNKRLKIPLQFLLAK